MSVSRDWEVFYYGVTAEELYKCKHRIVPALECVDRIKDAISFGRERDGKTDEQIIAEIENLLKHSENSQRELYRRWGDK